MHKPSLGRIVIAAVNPQVNNGSDVAPAIITRVFSDNLVNVRVLLDGDTVEWKTSVTLHAERPDDTGHAVWWPARV